MLRNTNKAHSPRKKVSQRTSVTFKINLYNRIHKLQRKTKVKSFSRAVNILLNDELANRKELDSTTVNNLTEILILLTQQIGRINQKISGACNNLNQIAYNLNLKKYKGIQTNTAKVMVACGERLITGIDTLKDQEKDIKNIRRRMNKIWQYLM